MSTTFLLGSRCALRNVLIMWSSQWCNLFKLLPWFLYWGFVISKPGLSKRIFECINLLILLLCPLKALHDVAVFAKRVEPKKWWRAEGRGKGIESMKRRKEREATEKSGSRSSSGWRTMKKNVWCFVAHVENKTFQEDMAKLKLFLCDVLHHCQCKEACSAIKCSMKKHKLTVVSDNFLTCCDWF